MPSATPSPRTASTMPQSDYFSEATTSKVTLEELKKRKLESKENDIEWVFLTVAACKLYSSISCSYLVRTHKSELRELYYLLDRQENLELEGSPAIPPPDDLFTVDDNDEKYKSFAGDYILARYVALSKQNDLRC